ncbi:hypothetical protein CARUB_v10006339mg [Capsella rubella]|uniref:Uncharacterized protein n=1 Tax=Capsella rubella TaxID=81985 RepID=R0H023_9BRAS|nr:uncharacterized protein LOC17880427 [Capsella rubella]EOA17930.1 hypothetical protein CARUB_v10006339mg [Capsella rubella]
MLSMAAAYAHLQLIQKNQKEEIKKREKMRNSGDDAAHHLLPAKTSSASGKISNKIYPSRLSYEQVEAKSRK